MGFFIASVFVASMISMAVLTGIIHREITDIRQIFIFHVSHIRFALLICVAVFYLLWFIFSGEHPLSIINKILVAALAALFLIFLVIM